MNGPGFKGGVTTIDGQSLAGVTKGRAFKAVEFYGTSVRPRVRWTCPRCSHRNDAKLQPPLKEREPVVCRRCKRPDVVRMLVAEEGGA